MFHSSKPANPPRKGGRPYVLILPAAIVVFAYVSTYLVLPNRGFWINDNGCKFIQMQEIIRSNYHTFSIPWPGEKLDPEFAFNSLPDPFGHVIDGRLFAQSSPVFALVSSFPNRLFGVHGLYVLPVLGGLVMLPAAWCLARELSRSPLTPPVAVLLVGLATPTA